MTATDTPSGRAARVVVIATAAIAVLHAVCLLWDAAAQGQGLARAVRTLLGLYVLMVGPGAIVALCLTRKPRLGGVAFLSRAWAGNIGLLAGATIAIKATGAALNPWVTCATVLALTAASLVWFAVRRPGVELVLGPGRTAAHVAAAMVLCPLLVLAAARPWTVTDHSYWPLETERALLRLSRVSHPADRQCPAAFPEPWVQLGPRHYEARQWPATMAVTNPGPAPQPYALKLLVEAHAEGTLTLRHGAVTVASVYLPPRFSRPVHPRNYPPPNAIVQATIDLTPGENPIVLAFRREDAATGPARLVVTHLTGLAPAAARRLFRRYYVVAPVGDVQSNLSLSRNLNDRIWLFTHSYNGSRFDAGGHTISNLPFPYYVDNLALLLMGDSPTSIDVLHLGLLGSFVPILVALAGAWVGPRRVHTTWLAFASMLCYGMAMRLHIESLYVHTILTYVFLLCVYHFLRGERGWFTVEALFVLTSKGGAVLLALLIGWAFVLLVKDRKRTLVDGAIVLGMGAAGLLAFGVGQRVRPELSVWQAEAKSDEYAGRFKTLQSLTQDAWARSRPLRVAGAKLTVLVLLVSCLLPAWLCRSRDGQAWLLAAVAGSFHLIVCLADPSVVSLAAVQHPLNYFVPAAPLLAAAGLRGLHLSGRRPGWIQGVLCALCLIGTIHMARIHHQPWRVPKHEAMHATALGDFLVRRAIVRVRQGDYALAFRDARRAAQACEPQLDEAIVPPVCSHALIVQGHAALMLGRNDEAVGLLRKALDAYPAASDAVEGLADRLSAEGQDKLAGQVRQVLADPAQKDR